MNAVLQTINNLQEERVKGLNREKKDMLRVITVILDALEDAKCI